jgi:hypothetical protein
LGKNCPTPDEILFRAIFGVFRHFYTTRRLLGIELPHIPPWVATSRVAASDPFLTKAWRLNLQFYQSGDSGIPFSPQVFIVNGMSIDLPFDESLAAITRKAMASKRRELSDFTAVEPTLGIANHWTPSTSNRKE